jgi:hypothetical protein
MQINEDGLRLISEDKDALSMVGMVKRGYRFLMLYACCGGVDVNHRPVGNPKRKV